MLPKTYALLTKSGAILLNSYNVVGDGTPNNLTPILTGKLSPDLPEARKSVKNASFVDDVYPFVWNKFKEAGYATLHSEDCPSMGTYTLQ